jgi:DNA ligase-1
MSTPSKRRKRNDGSGEPSKGIDFFFAKQQEKNAKSKEPISDVVADAVHSTNIFSDEELARKLQDEWNQEGQAQEPQRDGEIELPSEGRNIESVSTPSKSLKDLTQRPSPFASPAKTLGLQSAGTDEDTVTSKIPFDESPLQFDPSTYIADLQHHWAADNGRATYALLTRCFVLVNATTSRIKIVDTLVNMLRTIIESDPDSLLPAVSCYIQAPLYVHIMSN